MKSTTPAVNEASGSASRDVLGEIAALTGTMSWVVGSHVDLVIRRGT
jgi:hypothetical protein